MTLNPFVIDKSSSMGVQAPDIDVQLTEHYGQLAEDIIVSSLLTAWAERVGQDLASSRYLEIGANHPFATSSSYLLHRRHNMSGVLVEANPDLLETIKTARPADTIEHCAVVAQSIDSVEFHISNQSELSSVSKDFVEDWRGGEVGVKKSITVPALRVNGVLEKHFADEAPVFLAIDIEGLDLEVLEDMNWSRWRPVVVQAEPSDHFQAHQSTKIVQFMHSRGYLLVARTAYNQIFADRATLLSAAVNLDPSNADSATPQAAFLSPKDYYPEDVSVGIVTRTKNRPVLLRRALESVKNQSYPHWQLVVVNDGGAAEPVEELVATLFQGDNRVSIVHHPASVGMEAASNAGLSRLETELATIHDDDDSWAPDMLAITTQTLRLKNSTMPSVRGIVTKINLVEETVTGNLIDIAKVSNWNDHSRDRLAEGLIDLPRLSMQNLFPPIGFIFDLSIAREIGGFDEELPVLGDWDFHLRFCTQQDIWVHPEALAFYHLRANATGDMGNTVIAGQSKHELYNSYVRNKWLRNADNRTLGLIALLREQGLRLDAIESKNEEMSWNLSGGSWRKNDGKTGISAFLSDLNRKRKSLRGKKRSKP